MEGQAVGHRPRRLLGRLRPGAETELDARGAQPHDVDPPGGQLEQVDRAPAAVHDTLELAAASLLDDPEPAEVHDAGHDAPGRVERHPQLLRVLVDPALDLSAADEVQPGPDVGDLQRAEDGEERDEDAAETHGRDRIAPGWHDQDRSPADARAYCAVRLSGRPSGQEVSLVLQALGSPPRPRVGSRRPRGGRPRRPRRGPGRSVLGHPVRPGGPAPRRPGRGQHARPLRDLLQPRRPRPRGGPGLPPLGAGVPEADADLEARRGRGVPGRLRHGVGDVPRFRRLRLPRELARREDASRVLDPHAAEGRAARRPEVRRDRGAAAAASSAWRRSPTSGCPRPGAG